MPHRMVSALLSWLVCEVTNAHRLCCRFSRSVISNKLSGASTDTPTTPRLLILIGASLYQNPVKLRLFGPHGSLRLAFTIRTVLYRGKVSKPNGQGQKSLVCSKCHSLLDRMGLTSVACYCSAFIFSFLISSWFLPFFQGRTTLSWFFSPLPSPTPPPSPPRYYHHHHHHLKVIAVGVHCESWLFNVLLQSSQIKRTAKIPLMNLLFQRWASC